MTGLSLSLALHPQQCGLHRGCVGVQIIIWEVIERKEMLSGEVGIKAIRALVSDLPGGAVVNNPPASAGNMGSSPGLGRSYVPRSK